MRPPPALEAASAALRAWLDPPPSAAHCKALMLRCGAGGVNLALALALTHTLTLTLAPALTLTLTRYGVGGVNYAHQDQNSSPWQAALLLNSLQP